ncbi:MULTISPECIES: porin family protein [Sphingobacterium]|uniref:Porin family protein n=1 Tax=Sphingobacterium tenebrionis TaxID=3111775 RepID=A0ABU8I7V5_9SPHI|nr:MULTISPECIES: porin family protein [unclassified Sphingobacterium]QBR12802.1 PorT family protein [Sphingobacterium sp. CZ-2]
MKKLLLSFGAVVLLAAGAQAQTSYGLKAGVNLGKYSNQTEEAKDYQKNNVSFYVTGFADIPVAPQFSIQPGVSLQGKGAKYEATGDNVSGTSSTNTMSVEIPVNAVYYIPAGTGNVFLGAGPYVGFNISGKTKAEGALGGVEGSVDRDLKFSGDNKDMNLIDAGVNFLGGYKFGNGLLINAGYGLGLSNLSPSDNSDNKFSNRVLSFGLGFQF